MQSKRVRRKGREIRESNNSLAHHRRGSNWLFVFFALLACGKRPLAVRPNILWGRNPRAAGIFRKGDRTTWEVELAGSQVRAGSIYNSQGS